MDAIKIKPFPWMCPDCREKTVVPAQRDYSLTADHDGLAYQLTLHGVMVPTCTRCGTAIITSDLSERITAELRRSARLLLPEEIRRKREALGMTQSQLASALRVGEATFGRWEEGMQLQPRAVDLLLRLFLESAEVRRACVSDPMTPIPAAQVPAGT
jgi:putative zinc finger/helix-turn-helix YgiT family protein